jgi:transcriptional regulator with XRE-family HTH domain
VKQKDLDGNNNEISVKTTNKSGDKAINGRIKQIRQALNLTQMQFCEKIFLTGGHYAGIELGNRRVNDRTIKLIVTIFGVHERFLRTGEGEMFDKTPDYKLAQVVHIFQELPTDFQDYILKQIEELQKLNKSEETFGKQK